MPVWVEAPAEPGDHLLEIDLVHEHVRWFEAPLRVPVAVAARRAVVDPAAQGRSASC